MIFFSIPEPTFLTNDVGNVILSYLESLVRKLLFFNSQPPLLKRKESGFSNKIYLTRSKEGFPERSLEWDESEKLEKERLRSDSYTSRAGDFFVWCRIWHAFFLFPTHIMLYMRQYGRLFVQSADSCNSFMSNKAQKICCVWSSV